MANLEIEIGADNSELNKKIKEAEFNLKELANVKIDRIKLGLDTKEIDGNIKDVKKSLTDLKTTLKDTGNSFGAMQPKVASGGNALMQFSRIAQDAPFGIMGIGNNITATVESFGHLRNATGSAGAALKAIGASILGSGGILLGVSLLTTGLTYLAQSGLSVGDLIDKLTGNFNGFSNAVKTASIESAKLAAEETSSINALISVAQNETLAKKNRLAAIDDLQKKYPAYFGNLSKEQIMTQDLTGVVNDLSKALINRAIAAKLSESAVEPTLKLWQANARLLSLKKQLDEQEKENTKNLKAFQKQGESTAAFVRTMQLKDALKGTRSEIIELTKEVEKYQKGINQAQQKASSLLIEAPKAPKKQKAAKPTFDIPDAINVETNLQTAGLADTSGMILQVAKNVQGAEGMITTSMGKIRTQFDSSTLSMLETMYNFNTEMNELITGSLTDTFNQLGNSIGEAMASGGNVFSAIGNTLLQSLGKFLSEMGGLLIKYGVLAVAKGKIDLAMAPGGTIAVGAGLAAIAVGVALKAAGAAIGSKASSGGKSNSVQGGNSYSSPTSSVGSSSGGGSFSGGTVVFEISGQSLIGVLSNTLDKNKRLGGSITI